MAPMNAEVMKATERELSEITTRFPWPLSTTETINGLLYDWGGPWCASALVTYQVSKRLASVPLPPVDTLYALVDVAGGFAYRQALVEKRQDSPAVIARCLELASALMGAGMGEK